MKSPDDVVEAVVIESDFNATTSFLYEVRVVGRGKVGAEGKSVATVYGALRDEQAYGLTPRWESPTHLTVEFWKAQEVRASVETVHVAGRQISVELRPGIPDPNAPPGGMGYNLWRKHVD